MKLSHMRVKTKLMLAFACLAGVVLIVAGLSLASLGRSNDRFTSYLNGVGQREHMVTDIRGAATRRAIAARNLVLVSTPADRDLELAAVKKSHGDVQVAVAKLKKTVGEGDASDIDRRLFTEIESIEVRYTVVALSIVDMVVNGQRDAGVAKMNADCRPLLAALMKATQDFIEHGQEDAHAKVAAAEAAYRNDRLMLLTAGVVAVLFALAMGWLLAQAITVPLLRAVGLAEAVASGDLRSDIVVDRFDETGNLLAALKRMNDGLGEMVTRVRQSADGIATASAEIATGNMDLSSRTEQQASALEQTSASMQEMTSRVQQNADSSRQASQLASAAADVAGRGGQVVDRVVSTMNDITSSSKKIGDIIGVIDGIAFQTNILALNAAVEAARAGEQGRGFAVVASEVRSLAQRSAEAAKEIKRLIGDSVDRVEAGAQLVGEAGTTMTDVVRQVRQVTSLMSEINASTSEQSSGIQQVNQAVSSLDQGTQQNAALVEQSAAAAESLKNQAADLLQVIAVFKTR
ncbi:MAG: hypothetical protein RLZZ618_2935 [Pseudomonadota bacterium]